MSINYDNCIVDISNLSLNGLNGRCLQASFNKTNKDTHIVLVAGMHTSAERMSALAQNFAEYAPVFVPDLPGFGGMDSLYKVHSSPSLDNVADYLATYILRYHKDKKLIIGGMSYGFIVVTRMLQRHPNIAEQVKYCISLVGFTHAEDFKFSKPLFGLILYSSSFFKHYLPSLFLKYCIYRPVFVRAGYNILSGRHIKMRDADKTELKRRIDFEIILWQINDMRTYMATLNQMMRLKDLVTQRIELPLHHVSVDTDQYFNNQTVINNMKKIYKSVVVHNAIMPNHVPTIISDPKESAPFIPGSLRDVLNKNK